MKTNKTKEQAWKLERPERFISTNQVYNAGWNAALASVVEEPVLTEEDRKAIFDICTEAWESKTRWTQELRDQIMPKIDALLAGRIPAGNPEEKKCQICGSTIFPHLCGGHGNGAYSGAAGPAKSVNAGSGINTPQQEGGLTREWFDDQIADLSMNDPTRRNAKERLWIRITKALEAVREEYMLASKGFFARIEDLCKEITTLRAELAETEAARFSAVKELFQAESDRACLTADLAEAKKGRYAIGDGIELLSDFWISGKVGFVPDPGFTGQSGIVTNVSNGSFHFRKPEVPTVEQMMEEWVKWRMTPDGTHDYNEVTEAEAWRELAKENYTPGQTLESLWRRDCKGGVE